MIRRSLAALVLIAAVALASTGAASAHPRTVDLQLLNVSDWHAQLDPLNGVGGAAVLWSPGSRPLTASYSHVRCDDGRDDEHGRRSRRRCWQWALPARVVRAAAGGATYRA
jgi:2',3'-cyclic-nucleotide 2'-phosphodiesterase (5'-nucleotidase family)